MHSHLAEKPPPKNRALCSRDHGNLTPTRTKRHAIYSMELGTGNLIFLCSLKSCTMEPCQQTRSLLVLHFHFPDSLHLTQPIFYNRNCFMDSQINMLALPRALRSLISSQTYPLTGSDKVYIRLSSFGSLIIKVVMTNRGFDDVEVNALHELHQCLCHWPWRFDGERSDGRVEWNIRPWLFDGI